MRPSEIPWARRNRWVRLNEVAARQDGSISHEQLRWLGFSRHEIAGMLRRGQLIPIHRGVYAVGHAKLSDRGLLVAALLTAPEGAWISQWTAAGLWGLERLHTGVIHLTIPGASRRGGHDGLVVHRTRRPPHPDELTRRDGIAVSSVTGLLVELAPRAGRPRLERLITESVRHELFRLDEVEAALARHAGEPGMANLRGALHGYRDPVASGWEDRFYDWLMEDPRVPEPERDVIVHGWEVDLYWAARQFGLELDGDRWHRSVFDRGKDRRKDSDLQLHGIRVMRVDELRWGRDRPGIRRDVNGFLGLEN